MIHRLLYQVLTKGSECQYRRVQLEQQLALFGRLVECVPDVTDPFPLGVFLQDVDDDSFVDDRW